MTQRIVVGVKSNTSILAENLLAVAQQIQVHFSIVENVPCRFFLRLSAKHFAGFYVQKILEDIKKEIPSALDVVFIAGSMSVAGVCLAHDLRDADFDKLTFPTTDKENPTQTITHGFFALCDGDDEAKFFALAPRRCLEIESAQFFQCLKILDKSSTQTIAHHPISIITKPEQQQFSLPAASPRRPMGEHLIVPFKRGSSPIDEKIEKQMRSRRIALATLQGTLAESLDAAKVAGAKIDRVLHALQHALDHFMFERDLELPTKASVDSESGACEVEWSVTENHLFLMLLHDQEADVYEMVGGKTVSHRVFMLPGDAGGDAVTILRAIRVSFSMIKTEH